MQIFTSFVAFVAFLAVPIASLNLDNGAGISSVTIPTVTIRGVTNTTLEARGSINCKGSGRCSNSKGFTDQCVRAFNKIQDISYTAGGSKSGVCSGNCGIFVQATPNHICPIAFNGADLRGAYNNLRANGCKACGSDELGNISKIGCEITINYVTGC